MFRDEIEVYTFINVYCIPKSFKTNISNQFYNLISIYIFQYAPTNSIKYQTPV